MNTAQFISAWIHSNKAGISVKLSGKQTCYHTKIHATLRMLYFNEFLVLCLSQAVRQMTVIYNSQSSSSDRMMKDCFSLLCQQSFFSSLLLFSVHCLPLASSVTRQCSLQTLFWLAENKLFSQWCEIYQIPPKLHLETPIQALVWGWSIA